MKHCLFYGSLKSNHYNFGRFSGQKLIKSDIKLEGYEMFNLGAYPCIVEGKGTVTAELQEVSDEAYANIQRMEAGAGYSRKEIDIDGVKATLFIMNKEEIGDWAKKVESGNW